MVYKSYLKINYLTITWVDCSISFFCSTFSISKSSYKNCWDPSQHHVEVVLYCCPHCLKKEEKKLNMMYLRYMKSNLRSLVKMLQCWCHRDYCEELTELTGVLDQWLSSLIQCWCYRKYCKELTKLTGVLDQWLSC